MLRNAIKVIKEYSVSNRINRWYDLYNTEAKEIIKNASSKEEICFDAFVYGYAMGQRATLAEMKKKAVKV